MTPTLGILPLHDLPADIGALCVEAAGEGFRFMEKCVVEWRCGTNRFAQPGEVLLAAFRASDLVAVGGLNRDPYADQPGIGRLRHVYVRPSARRAGVGATLVRALLAHAEGSFDLVRLRTATRQADSFYAALGFLPVQGETASHVLALPRP